jgi:uncharacterized protein YndB with AHSA1/START domain
MTDAGAMTDAGEERLSVVVERELAHPPGRIWRALTQPQLMAEWLMASDFRPDPGHRFDFTAEWGRVECKVIEVAPERVLAYSWDAMGLESTVTWTLTPTNAGTRLRMEQVGFRPDQRQAYGGARVGWQRFFGKLEALLARLD